MNRKYDQAIHYFQSALRLSPRNVRCIFSNSQSSVSNTTAETCHLCALQASILAALGFTYHMKGNLEEAIESYHAVSRFALSPCGGSISSLTNLNDLYYAQALAYNPEETLAGEMITVAFEESLSSRHSSLSSLDVPEPESRTPMGMHSGLLGRPTDTSQTEDAVRRTLRLDNSFSSIEPSHRSLAYSSLDFSDDSSMNLDE